MYFVYLIFSTDLKDTTERSDYLSAILYTHYAQIIEEIQLFIYKLRMILNKNFSGSKSRPKPNIISNKGIHGICSHECLSDTRSDRVYTYNLLAASLIPLALCLI